MKPWRKCCHFWDKALCHVLLQPSLPPSEGRKEGIGGGSLWTWLGCRWCRPTHWHNPRMASECAHSKFEFPPSPLLLSSAHLHIYCMYYLTLSFKKLLEKWGLTHFFGLSTTVCRRPWRRRRATQWGASRGFPFLWTQSRVVRLTGCSNP